MERPWAVYLYAEPTAATLDSSQLSQYIAYFFPHFKVNLRDSFVSFYLSTLPETQHKEAISQLALEMARAKVRNPLRLNQGISPLLGEIDYERRRLSNLRSSIFGILYDGYQMMKLLQKLIPSSERSLKDIHIVFTNQLVGTWEDSDKRYHARVNICGFPSIISTTGIVEAPAKPKEYYWLKQQYNTLGMGDAVVGLDMQFRGRFIEHQDKRLTEVMKGYVMQVLFYHLTGEPFCEDRDCRLYNAHWQEEVIRAQLGNKHEFCPLHQSLLSQLRDNMP